MCKIALQVFKKFMCCLLKVVVLFVLLKYMVDYNSARTLRTEYVQNRTQRKMILLKAYFAISNSIDIYLFVLFL